jgi:TonB family protein
MHAVSGLFMTFLLNSLWQVTLIALAGRLCSRLLRGAAGRHLYRLWASCLGLAVLLPLLSLLYPNEIIPKVLIAPFAATANSAIANSETWLAAWRRLVGAKFLFSEYWIAGISALYFVFLAGRLARFFSAWRKAKSMRESAHVAELPLTLTDAVRRCRKAFGLQAVPVLCSRVGCGPLTTGIWRPVVIVPEFLLAHDAQEHWLPVLAHEFAHVSRRDCLFHLLQQLLYWPISFHPAAAMIQRQISAAREHACDEMATERLVDRAVYARSLVRIADMMPGLRAAPLPGYGLGIFDADILEERIMKLLTNNTSSAWRTKTALALTALVLLALSVSASAFSFKVNHAGDTAVLISFAAAPSPGEDVLKIGPGVTPPKLITKANPSYPAEAKRAKREGVVVVAAVITEKGLTEDVRVVKSVAPDLDESAVSAVRQWKFEPALKDGKPVKVAIKLEINYSLK